MKVLDLQCRQGHVFEGWFACEEDFRSQQQRGLVQCPLCADEHIEKRLSAPRLNLGARAAPGANDSAAADAGAQAARLALARKLMANTEDVGPRFAQEARRMHHGEVPERAIRGQATPHDALQLIEEGIAVLPMPLPVAAKETLQ
ncbi:DUF1178 family protein [Verminephrobacter eiseniae]|uniref:DUF1178 family protein n=1 Tax=Verminephrobacter eiseniae TaxID=364317 RepID=UPI0010E412D3|nr:DUF1178 family protein [Verminephrobacter eiseniae]KAB7591246.1 DUF1178 family protein [Verminephrobacter sp. Larva24]MCW5231857.1 DUF1178 family protein [Verminephrobacter eiseniae]MCW5293591.1 DUF1178 family protein [Verminephrobacter eiseniae]MCW8186115.1 DUF1178 family protein [Verminephrobacter eiseniae]MCW8224644.1 DUF1178 family protein [Verminephrobacter eiseniae]